MITVIPQSVPGTANKLPQGGGGQAFNIKFMDFRWLYNYFMPSTNPANSQSDVAGTQKDFQNGGFNGSRNIPVPARARSGTLPPIKTPPGAPTGQDRVYYAGRSRPVPQEVAKRGTPSRGLQVGGLVLDLAIPFGFFGPGATGGSVPK
jgi:hypothetical protein